MRYSTYISRTRILLVLLTVAGAQAGLVHRQNRNTPATAENLIPVQIIQDGQDLTADKIQESPEIKKAEESKKATAILTGELAASDAQAAPTKLADKVSTLLDKERQEDEEIIEQEIKQAIVEENKEILQAAAIAEQTAAEPQNTNEQQLLKQAQEINSDLSGAGSNAAAAAAYFSAPDLPKAKIDETPKEPASSADHLTATSSIADNTPAESENVPTTSEDKTPSDVVAGEEEHTPAELVRQAAAAAATQATPTQTSTPANFVAQLLQNSPIGQFFGQLTGQQQQQQSVPGAQVAADQPATPAPTLPGFLNPQNAITQVQNAAQSVANATAQAFQGVQQFANNLGTQFQNTLSSLGGQPQQQSTSDSTTTRPPGPIQSLISNFVGGNQPSGAAAAAGVGATPNPAQQQQGPIQGIISFFQGGTNRPQAVAAAGGGSGVGGGAAVVASASPTNAAAQLDNKVDDVQEVDQAKPLTDAEPEAEQGGADQIDNEVRNSAEVSGIDSLEANSPSGQYIIVNDDISQQDQRDEVKDAAVV